MPYVIQATDKAGSAQVRAGNRAAHFEYLIKHQEMLLAAGALTEDDGGVRIVDTDERKEAERFSAEDPFSKAGLFEKLTPTRWRKAFSTNKS